MRITEAPKDYTVVYDDTEESSALESEEGGGGVGGRGVMARVMSLERRGVRMVDTKDRQGGGMFTSNKETVRKLVEEESRAKVPRNKSFKQAVGAGLGHGQGSPSGEQRRRRRRKSLEEQLVRNTEVRTRRNGRSKNPQNLAKVKS